MAEDKDSEAVEEKEGEKKSKSTLLITIMAVLLGIGVGGGVVFFLVDSKSDGAVADIEPEPEPEPSIYYRFSKPFVVDITTKGGQHYLQIAISVKTKQQEVITLIKAHDPMLKSLLNSVLSSQSLEYLQSTDGRQGLNNSALSIVQTFVTSKDETLLVDQLLFTDFVIQ